MEYYAVIKLVDLGGQGRREIIFLVHYFLLILSHKNALAFQRNMVKLEELKRN